MIRLAPRPEHSAGVAQKRAGFVRLEIADGRPGKESGMHHPGRCGRQGEGLREVGFDRQDRKARIVAAKLFRFLDEHLRGNVDRHIGRDRAGGREQDAHLLARAAAEFDKCRARRKKPRHVRRTLAQQLKLATRRVIFGQRGDILEKLRARLVIEIFRREPLRPRRQPGNDVTRERRIRLDGLVTKSGAGLRSHGSTPLVAHSRGLHPT